MGAYSVRGDPEVVVLVAITEAVTHGEEERYAYMGHRCDVYPKLNSVIRTASAKTK